MGEEVVIVAFMVKGLGELNHSTRAFAVVDFPLRVSPTKMGVKPPFTALSVRRFCYQLLPLLDRLST